MHGSHSALAGFKFGESGCGCINKSKLVSFNLASFKNIRQITKLNTSSKFPTITVWDLCEGLWISNIKRYAYM